MLPIFTNNDGKVRNILRVIITITGHCNNGIFVIFRCYSNESKTFMVIDVQELKKQIIGKSIERPQKAQIYAIRMKPAE